MRPLCIFLCCAVAISASSSGIETVFAFEGLLEDVEECKTKRPSFFIVHSDDATTQALLKELSDVAIERWQPQYRAGFEWSSLASNPTKQGNLLDASSRELTIGVESVQPISLDSVLQVSRVFFFFSS